MNDGVSLSSASHPIAPLWKMIYWRFTWVLYGKRRFNNSIEEITIDIDDENLNA